MPRPSQFKVVATNRRARHDFEILETFEAGIELAGSEVKALRLGHADLAESYAAVERGQLWICQLHIKPFQYSPYAPAPVRKRRLLVHRAELDRLAGQLARKGTTLVPLKLYFSDRGWAKVELGMAKGRTHADRRADIKKKVAEREMRSARAGER
ncbi:MAG: SsrA-binding protein SmpB [bacterium]